jgi:exopolyphosphatase/guanosine-5'-triphosphate,3'-diphosphate pyrophosphatase
MERGWDCLRLFSEQLQDIPSDNIRVVGTATLRLATNVDEFISEAERVLNHSIEIISGEEEPRPSMGVSWTSAGEGNRLVIDIGGASTELVIGEHGEAKLLNSLHMGCVTWLNNHFGDGELSEARFKQAIAAAKAVLRRWRKIIAHSAGVPVSAPPARCRRCRRSCWRREERAGHPAQAARS